MFILATVPPPLKPDLVYKKIVQEWRRPYILGRPKNAKVRYKLADKLITFLWVIIRSTENFKFLGGLEVLPLDSKNPETGYFTIL